MVHTDSASSDLHLAAGGGGVCGTGVSCVAVISGLEQCILGLGV